MQSDPIGLGGGLNTYAYVYANPLLYLDQFGLECSVSSVNLSGTKQNSGSDISEWDVVGASFERELIQSRVVLNCFYSRTVTEYTDYFNRYGTALREICVECGVVVSDKLINIEWGDWQKSNRVSNSTTEEETKSQSLPQYAAPNRAGRGGPHARAAGQCLPF